MDVAVLVYCCHTPKQATSRDSSVAEGCVICLTKALAWLQRIQPEPFVQPTPDNIRCGVRKKDYPARVFAYATPAIEALIKALGPNFIWGQVRVQRVGESFVLIHAQDEQKETALLQNLDLAGLRAMASMSWEEDFRPLRSAPNLMKGWRCEARSEGELEQALNQIYPGSVADWFAAQQANVSVTNYREFTGRQTGMYRITTMLNDAQAAAVVRATCHSRFCLKQRLWSIGELPVDRVEEKSLIPCLEPCAILLETARKAMRIEQEDKVKLEVAPSELVSLLATVEKALGEKAGEIKTADLSAPLNPKRLQLLLEKYSDLLRKTPEPGENEG